MSNSEVRTIESLEEELKNDTRIKVAGLDVDGILRGKIMSKNKFFSALKNDGFGMCSVIMGWDCHDKQYEVESTISNNANGFQDIIAKIDMASFRRIPWEDNQPFFLLSFHTSDGTPLSPDPRSLLKTQCLKASAAGFKAMAGLELEFFNFLETPATLEVKSGRALTPLTPGNFGYSLLRPLAAQSKSYFTSIYDTALEFGCPIEGWHTETGPGVYEAALEFADVATIADRGSLFKFLCKSLGLQHGITPCFMAKPALGLSGNSGHIHISLVDSETGRNLFGQEEANEAAQYKDLRHFSNIGQHFTAGILEGLPDIMPLLAPTINSYKRLIENYWAPVDVRIGYWRYFANMAGFLGPRTPLSFGSTDFAPLMPANEYKVRVPGADIVPHYALAALLGLGLRGVQKKMAFPMPPLGAEDSTKESVSRRLAKDLKEATTLFMRPESLAREVLGDSFVDHFGLTRLHEIKLWEMQVTEYELKRYMEIV